MATHVYVALEIDEARYLADLIGVKYDVKTTLEWCNQFDFVKNDQHLFWLVEPLTTAILIRFIRAFGGGVRHKTTSSLLSDLCDTEMDYYDYFKNIRDKHVAHSVNEFEENEVKAYYVQESIENGINSIGEGCTRVVGLSGDDIENIRKICTKLIKNINSEISIEKEKLLKITSNYTEEEIKKLKATVSKQVSDIDVTKARK